MRDSLDLKAVLLLGCLVCEGIAFFNLYWPLLSFMNAFERTVPGFWRLVERVLNHL